MSKNRIVFVVEGKVAEPKLLSEIAKSIGIEASQIYPYETNIYSLYRHYTEYKKSFANEADDVDLFSYILELESEKEKDEQNDIVNLSRREVSEIYLFFDLDGHHHSSRSDLDFDQNMREVAAMINEFSNETGAGKLYISYPMVEALKLYQKKTSDKVAFYRFKLDEKKTKSGKTFKAVCEEHKDHFNFGQAFSEQDIEWIKLYHILLSREIYQLSAIGYEEYREKISTRETFEKQLNTFKCNERSFVFSSVAEFLLDYVKEKDFPDLANLQDCEREIVDKWDDIEGI